MISLNSKKECEILCCKRAPSVSPHPLKDDRRFTPITRKNGLPFATLETEPNTPNTFTHFMHVSDQLSYNLSRIALLIYLCTHDQLNKMLLIQIKLKVLSSLSLSLPPLIFFCRDLVKSGR